MSRQQLAPVDQINGLIVSEQDRFVTMAGDSLQFEQECGFALQQIMKTDFATKIAIGNPQSVQNAVGNLAATGLSLNPAHQYAYLVPMDNAIQLQIGYRGLCKLATDSGVIAWVQAEMVHEHDVFRLTGLSSEPVHERNPFGDRGNVVGVYCVAHLSSGDYLTTSMPWSEVEKIRNGSKAWQSKKERSVWGQHPGEMAKKTVVKRASKMWPMSGAGADRMNAAVSMLNAQEGSADIRDATPVLPRAPLPVEYLSDAQVSQVADMLTAAEDAVPGNTDRWREHYGKQYGAADNLIGFAIPSGDLPVIVTQLQAKIDKAQAAATGVAETGAVA